MLEIKIPAKDQWDEKNECFITTKEQVLRFEHSLVSLSKWESKWCKHFIDNKELNEEELLDYIKCMTLNKDVDDNTYALLSASDFEKIVKYINAPMTATWFSEEENKYKKKQIITSEVIYASMVALQIPFECQKWHLNRLLTLIRVCNENNKPKEKMNKRDIMKRNASLNAQRRAKMNSKG